MAGVNVARSDQDRKEGIGDWRQAHAALTKLARERAFADAEEGRWFLRALRASVHLHLGYGSFGEYVERLFGYKPRTTHEKVRVAEALEALPRLRQALESGVVSWSAVRELTRVATIETEAAWLEAARSKTTRDLEDLVAGKRPGDIPGAIDPSSSRRHVLRFEVEAETFASFREAMQRLRRDAGGTLDDDAILLSMARQVLGGPRDDGQSSYQVSFEVCTTCGSGAQVAGGTIVPVDAEVAAMAACDARHLGHRVPRAANENGATIDDTSVSAHVGAPVSAHVGTPEESDHSVRSGASAPPPAPLSGPLSGPDASKSANAREERRILRATQSIPPAVRRAVLARDRHCCRVPGCRNTLYLDVHHLRPRSDGGSNAPENLVTVCGAHHRAVHRGELLIEPADSGGVCFRHADGTAYGGVISADSIDAHSKVFSALRNLGFREREVHAVLRDLRADDQLRSATTECLLREALSRIRCAAR